VKLIVGLGNPGEKYAKTRHNLGFIVLDALARPALGWQFSKKFNAEICQLTPEILLAKPQTFMNASGMAVAKIFRYYDIKIPGNLWMVHDDVDLPLGRLKIRLGGAAAGHHGVESIIKELGTDEFVRFRLGIGHPQRGNDGAVEKYVLRSFDINEKSEMKQIIKKTVKAIRKALDQNLERAMNEFN
jgi:PTH1 family peptidyl-tRNA hydrolase